MSRTDNVQQLVLDHTSTDFDSSPVGAHTARADCLEASNIDVIIDFTALGAASIVLVVGRASGLAQPDPSVDADWFTINTEAVDTATGIATIVPYLGETPLMIPGQVVVSFPVRARYFSAVVWVNAGAGSRGSVYTFRRGA
jgi:hypothetical protein